jgi:hypothetical protein
LILSVVPKQKVSGVASSFRGATGHSLESLKGRYFAIIGGNVPGTLASSFSRIRVWSTDLRYSTKVLKGKEAARFLDSASVILEWADGRL